MLRLAQRVASVVTLPEPVTASNSRTVACMA
jgi:hypothetical protein